MRILLSADDVLLDAALEAKEGAAFLLDGLSRAGHDVTVVAKSRSLREAMLRYKALRRHFPALEPGQIAAAKNMNRLKGDIVVSAGPEDFGARRGLNVLVGTLPVEFKAKKGMRVERALGLFAARALIEIFNETGGQL